MSHSIVKVHGHVRSGNHAVAAFVQRAFYPDVEPLKVHRGEGGHWSRDRSSLSRVTVDGVDQPGEKVLLPYGRVLGGHRLPPDTSPAIYVFRDGRDVALSMWRWPSMRPADVESFHDFLRLPIDWRFSLARRFEWKKPTRVWDHWKWHLDAWVSRPDVLAVRYEEFVLDPADVLGRLSRFLGRDPVAVPENTMSGWNASEAAKISRWKTEMTDEDVALFDTIIPPDFIGRWERGHTGSHVG